MIVDEWKLSIEQDSHHWLTIEEMTMLLFLNIISDMKSNFYFTKLVMTSLVEWSRVAPDCYISWLNFLSLFCRSSQSEKKKPLKKPSVIMTRTHICWLKNNLMYLTWNSQWQPFFWKFCINWKNTLKWRSQIYISAFHIFFFFSYLYTNK